VVALRYRGGARGIVTAIVRIQRGSRERRTERRYRIRL